ncbi:MAG: hypothetical protein R2828_34535 [Saprospiraceae bacterium]
MNRTSFLSLLLFFIIFSSCHKVDLCHLQGDIQIGQIEEVLSLDCTLFGANDQIIRTEEELLNLFGDLPCQGDLPSIDFSQFTLLGQYGGASGCQRYFTRQLYIKHGAKNYTFTVKVSECGGCEPFATQWHWVLVPTLPEDYTVEFVFQIV